jgi:hypothetical protein
MGIKPNQGHACRQLVVKLYLCSQDAPKQRTVTGGKHHRITAALHHYLSSPDSLHRANKIPGNSFKHLVHTAAAAAAGCLTPQPQL